MQLHFFKVETYIFELQSMQFLVLYIKVLTYLCPKLIH